MSHTTKCSSLQTQYERSMHASGNQKIITDWNICTKSTDFKGLNHYYTLQSNKRLKSHGHSATISDMKNVQNIQMAKIFKENLILQW